MVFIELYAQLEHVDSNTNIISGDRKRTINIQHVEQVYAYANKVKHKIGEEQLEGNNYKTNIYEKDRNGEDATFDATIIRLHVPTTHDPEPNDNYVNKSEAQLHPYEYIAFGSYSEVVRKITAATAKAFGASVVVNCTCPKKA